MCGLGPPALPAGRAGASTTRAASAAPSPRGLGPSLSRAPPAPTGVPRGATHVDGHLLPPAGVHLQLRDLLHVHVDPWTGHRPGRQVGDRAWRGRLAKHAHAITAGSQPRDDQRPLTELGQEQQRHEPHCNDGDHTPSHCGLEKLLGLLPLLWEGIEVAQHPPARGPRARCTATAVHVGRSASL